MSHKDTLSCNKDPVKHCCLACLSSFGFCKQRRAHQCINPECKGLVCRQCLDDIQTYNGPEATYRCIYCVKEYSKVQMPTEDQEITKNLLDEAVIKYAIKRTDMLLSNSCNYKELICDIECRGNLLKNLIARAKHFPDDAMLYDTVLTGNSMVKQLSDISRCITERKGQDMDLYKRQYRSVISTGDNKNEIGMKYIEFCENLRLQISNAERARLFPEVHALLKTWLRPQGASDEFIPKLHDLYTALERDLKNQCSNPNIASRIRIGIIGYTSVGKSSIVNRLLGVKSLDEEGAAPVAEKKSTYCAMEFNRSEPLVNNAGVGRRTPVTFVDLPGLDSNRTSDNSKMAPGNYLDEIRQADCDIYIIVLDESLSEEQGMWIKEIETNLHHPCILVKSKTDENYLKKFKEYSGKIYLAMPANERDQWRSIIIQQLRQEYAVKSREVYLLACDYSPSTSDAETLVYNECFDFHKLLQKLSHDAIGLQRKRIYKSTIATLCYVINTCFRRSYIINVLKYQIAAGIAAVVPFGHKLPLYLSRETIGKTFGIDQILCSYLKLYDLTMSSDYNLQTPVFEQCVKQLKPQSTLKVDRKGIAQSIITTTAVVIGNVGDDLLRVAGPSTTVISTGARTLFPVAAVGVGVVLSVFVCGWVGHSSGGHIFRYVNRVCDDTIMVTDALILSILEDIDKRYTNNTNESFVDISPKHRSVQQ